MGLSVIFWSKTLSKRAIKKKFTDGGWFCFCHQDDIDLAVAAAKRAFHRNSEWRLYDASKRREILTKFADLIARDASYLAELESYNNGMLLTLARSFLIRAVSSVRYLASLADKSHGDTIPIGNIF